MQLRVVKILEVDENRPPKMKQMPPEGKSKMKNNYLHTGNTTKKSSARTRPVFRAFGVVAAVTLAGVALAAGPEHLGAQSSKSQIVAENLDASNNHGITTASVHFQARSGKNPIAEK